MKISSIVSALAIVSVTQAWTIIFVGKSKRVTADGTERNECNNLRSDFDQNTVSILFHPETSGWADATGYAAYSKANCKGTAYYGVKGQQNPNRRFRSYKVTSS